MTKPLPDHIADVLVTAIAHPLADIDQKAGRDARRRLQERSQDLARELTGNDPAAALSVAERLMAIVWREREAPWEWWETELGQACARALEGSTYGRGELSRREAARMLGVSRSRIDQLTRAGRLEKSGAGVLRASILRLVVDERRRLLRRARDL